MLKMLSFSISSSKFFASFPFNLYLEKRPPFIFVYRPITHALSKLLNYSSIWHTNYRLFINISLMFYLLLDFKLLLSYNATVLVSLYGLKFCRYKLQHNLMWKALLLASVSLLLLGLRFKNQRMWDLGKGERRKENFCETNRMERRGLRRVDSFC
jgi:hypothetical protein